MRFAEAVRVVPLLLLPSLALAQVAEAPPHKPVTRTFVYKKVKDVDLDLVVHYPPVWKESDRRPAIVFFNKYKFGMQADYLAGRGLVAAEAAYRTTNDVRDRIANGHDALRWLRANAGKLGIDPERIAAAGGSASAHVAACLGVGLEPATGAKAPAQGGEATPAAEGPAPPAAKVSSMPNALVLFNPILEVTGGPQIKKRIGDFPRAQARELSPVLHLRKDTPPALLMYGTLDRYLKQGEDYIRRARKLGVRADLYTAEGQVHSFFNNSPWKERTLYRVDQFLESMGWLKGPPTLKLP
jgi:dienelactone hydrolase